MDKDLKKLRIITAFMKKNGVLSLKTPENFEISLSPQAFQLDGSPKNKTKATDSAESAASKPEFSDEDILNWSAGQVVEGH